MKNEKLKKAKRNKNDEFYTQLSDIENELKHYRAHFRDKVVFCNCDDHEWSNFYKFFKDNFSQLGLRKLVSTYYQHEDGNYKLICAKVTDIDGRPTEEKTPLKGDGDFRSEECIELLRESDIVCTNPPFSLFREYVAQLIGHQKKFLIIGNFNAVTYKEIFRLIKSNKLWLGISPRSMQFKLPSGALKAVNATWFTNLTHKSRNEEITLWKEYCVDEYKRYDNFDAINIDKVSDIPANYTGYMGVPITFLSRHSPNQFQILGMSASAGYDEEIVGIPLLGSTDARPSVNRRTLYVRLFIRNLKAAQPHDGSVR